MLWREGAKQTLSVKFYSALIQVLLLVEAETWLLLSPMVHMLEEFHMGLLIHMTKLNAKRLKDGLWRKVAINGVLQGAGTKPLPDLLVHEADESLGIGGLMAYLLCMHQGYVLKGRGGALGDVLETSGSGEIAEGHVKIYFDSGKGAAERERRWSIGMMGQRQVTPGWEDNPVQRQDRRQWKGC